MKNYFSIIKSATNSITNKLVSETNKTTNHLANQMMAQATKAIGKEVLKIILTDYKKEETVAASWFNAGAKGLEYLTKVDTTPVFAASTTKKLSNDSATLLPQKDKPNTNTKNLVLAAPKAATVTPIEAAKLTTELKSVIFDSYKSTLVTTSVDAPSELKVEQIPSIATIVSNNESSDNDSRSTDASDNDGDEDEFFDATTVEADDEDEFFDANTVEAADEDEFFDATDTLDRSFLANDANAIDDNYFSSGSTEAKGEDNFVIIKEEDTHCYPKELTNKEFANNITDWIKNGQFDQLLHHLVGRNPDNLDNVEAGPQKGAFERGVVILEGLTQEEARDLHKALSDLNPYSRLSTHGDLTNGYDLPEHQYITTKVETFRHIVFAMPKPYKDGDNLNEGDSSLVDTHSDIDYQDVVTNEQFKDAKFCLRLKSESHGCKTLKDKLAHLWSFMHTRVSNDYKQKPGYYGDGAKNTQGNKNGCFTVNKAEGTIKAWGDQPNEVTESNHKQIKIPTALMPHTAYDIDMNYLNTIGPDKEDLSIDEAVQWHLAQAQVFASSKPITATQLDQGMSHISRGIVMDLDGNDNETFTDEVMELGQSMTFEE